MNYGLKVYNDNLNLQIDSMYINYCLHEHGENVTTVDLGNYCEVTVTFASPVTQPPLIAIKPSASDYCGLWEYTKSSNNYTGFVIRSTVDVPVTFSWQSFAPRTDKSSAVYGLRIYDSNAVLVFDSGYAAMIIADVDTANPNYNAVQTITHPSDSNAYYIVYPWGAKWQWNWYNGVSSFLKGYIGMLKSLSATQVSFGGIQGVKGIIQGNVNSINGFWPATWTVLTIKKAFF